jgi:hypothetical protein
MHGREAEMATLDLTACLREAKRIVMLEELEGRFFAS